MKQTLTTLGVALALLAGCGPTKAPAPTPGQGQPNGAQTVTCEFRGATAQGHPELKFYECALPNDRAGRFIVDVENINAFSVNLNTARPGGTTVLDERSPKISLFEEFGDSVNNYLQPLMTTDGDPQTPGVPGSGVVIHPYETDGPVRMRFWYEFADGI